MAEDVVGGEGPAESAGDALDPGAAEGAGPEERAPAGPAAESAVEEQTWLAPSASRVLAFAIDLVSVALVAAVPGGGLAWLNAAVIHHSLLVPVVVFALAVGLGVGVYSAMCVWLTEGQTAGKAMLGIAVRRAPGGPPRRDLKGLAWAAGRCLAGYAVIDVLGLGMLTALFTPGRLCVHDYVFGSQVVLVATEADRPGTQAVLARLRDWNQRREAAQADVAERYGWPLRLVMWLVKIVTLPVAAILALAPGRIGQTIWNLLGKVIKGATGNTRVAAAHTGAAPVAKLTLGITATVVTASVAVTGAKTLFPPSVSGTIPLPVSSWSPVGGATITPRSNGVFEVAYSPTYWGGVFARASVGCSYRFSGQARVLGGGGYGFAVWARVDSGGTPHGQSIQYDMGAAGYRDVLLPDGSESGTVRNAATDNKWHAVAVQVRDGAYTSSVDGKTIFTGRMPVKCTNGLFIRLWNSGDAEFQNLRVTPLSPAPIHG